MGEKGLHRLPPQELQQRPRSALKGQRLMMTDTIDKEASPTVVAMLSTTWLP